MTAVAEAIASRVATLTNDRKRAEAARYWELVHAVACGDEGVNPDEVAQFLAAAGIYPKKFTADVAIVNRRYQIDERLDAIPELREKIAGIEAEQRAAIGAFGKVQREYQERNEKFNAEMRTLAAEIATAEK